MDALTWSTKRCMRTGGVQSSVHARETLRLVLDLIETGKNMSQPRILEEASAKIREILAASPATDIEKNLRAMLVALFGKLELATREELDVQEKVLARTREKLSALEARVAELESRLRQR